MSIEDKQEQVIIIDEDERTNIDEFIQDKQFVVDIKEQKDNEEQNKNKDNKDNKSRKCNFKKIHPVIKLSLIINGCIGIVLTIYLLLHSFDLI